MLDTHGRKYFQPLIYQVARVFMKYNMSANQVTMIAFLLGISTGIFAFYGMGVIGVAIMWISGLLDAVDGTIAREKGSTPFGTVLDMTFDRLVEIAIIIGLALRYPGEQFQLLLLTCSIIFSMTVFLTTGMMAEKKGQKSFYYQAGVAERTEGFIFFSLMLIFPAYLKVIILIFFGLIVFTALQRMREAARLLS